MRDGMGERRKRQQQNGEKQNQKRQAGECGLNGLSDIVHFQCEDVFELLPELERAGEKLKNNS